MSTQKPESFVNCYACHGKKSALHWQKFGYDLWRCPDCGLLWVNPMLSDAEMTHFYEQEFFQGGHEIGYSDYGAVWRKRNYRREARAVEQSASFGRILDVGCAAGDFLDACSEKWNKFGLEISRFAGEQARSKYGDRIKIAHFKDAGFKDNFFDVVTMWETLNHLSNPLECLEHCARLLKPGGLLVFNVGDSSSLLARMLGRYWYQVTPPGHLFYFTPASIKIMIERCGLIIEKRTYPGKYASLAATLERFKDTTGSPGLTHLCRRLSTLGIGRFVYYINLRDTMLLFARKP